MKLLILTQYFVPETGAPQNRLFQLAKKLHERNIHVEVLTAMPNYPEMKVHTAYRGRFFAREIIEGITVHRSWIYAGTSKSIFPRLMNYFSFVLSSLLTGIYRTGRYDYIFCESPPLFLGISAFLLKYIKQAKLIFNVSDLWPESAEKLGLVRNSFLLGLTRKLEEFLYRQSFLVTGQTRGIVSNISGRFPDKKVFWLKNGADVPEPGSSVTDPGIRTGLGFSSEDFILIYAGILGHAQGLEVILSAAGKLRSNPNIHFIIMGSGPEKSRLIRMKEKMQLDNVHFLENRPRKEALAVISCSDVSVIPLKKIDLFRGAIPSKIFESLAVKKPLLLGVEGEAKELFIDQGGAGLSFIPEDPSDLAAKVLYLYDHRDGISAFGEQGYAFLRKEFNIQRITEEFSALLEQQNRKS